MQFGFHVFPLGICCARTNRLRRFCHRSPGGAVGTKPLRGVWMESWMQGQQVTLSVGSCPRHRVPLILSSLPAGQHHRLPRAKPLPKMSTTQKKEIYIYSYTCIYTHTGLIYPYVPTHFVAKHQLPPVVFPTSSSIFYLPTGSNTPSPFNKHTTGEQQPKNSDRPLQFPSFTLSE